MAKTQEKPHVHHFQEFANKWNRWENYVHFYCTWCLYIVRIRAEKVKQADKTLPENSRIPRNQESHEDDAPNSFRHE